MGYIGQQPAPKVITSSDLSADVVTEAKIADNAVENEHLNANVITGHTALGATPADTDELLVSDAGTLKRVDFSYLKGGGMYELIQTQTISSAVSSVEFTSSQFTTSHLDYLIIFSGVGLTYDGGQMEFLISSDGGSSFITTTDYFYGGHGEGSDGNLRSKESQDDNKIRLHVSDSGNATGENVSGVIELYDPLNQSSDDKFFSCTYRTVNYTSDNKVLNNYGGGGYKASGSEDTVFNGAKISSTGGNIDQGVFSIYGRKTS